MKDSELGYKEKYFTRGNPNVREINNRIKGFHLANYIKIIDYLKCKYIYGYKIDEAKVNKKFLELEVRIQKVFGNKTYFF